MSRARTFADLATASEENSLANRNLIINGDMSVAQRGTSLSIVHDGTSDGYACDRWLLQEVNHDQTEGTLAQVAVTDLAGFNNALKWTTTEPESAIAADESFDICQKLKHNIVNVLVMDYLVQKSNFKFLCKIFCYWNLWN